MKIHIDYVEQQVEDLENIMVELEEDKKRLVKVSENFGNCSNWSRLRTN